MSGVEVNGINPLRVPGPGRLPVKRSLLRSTSLVSANTTLSRIFGLVRDIVIARAFGPDTGRVVFAAAR